MGRGNGKGGFFDVLGELGGMLQAACCCVCLVFLLGPIFLIVGVSYVADATTDSRGEALKELQGDAAAWEDGHRADFDELDLAVDPGPNFGQRVLPAVTTGDRIADIGSQPDDLDITWTPLRYSALVDVPFNGVPGDTYTLYVGGEEVDQAGPFELCEYHYITLSNCRDTCSSSRRRGSQQCTSSCCPRETRCREIGGAYERYGGTMRCRVTLQLQEVCFVAPSGAGAGGATADPTLWTRQTTGFAESLPDMNGDLDPRKVHTSAGAYARVPVGQQCPKDILSRVRVTVRSADDPYLRAAVSTDYSFNFGNTQAENAKAGGTFIVLGLIFCTIPLCAGYAIYSCAQQRKRNPVNPQPQAAILQNHGLAGSRFAPDDGYGPNNGAVMQPMQPMVQQQPMMMQQAPMQPMMATQPLVAQPVMAQPVMAQPVVSVGQPMPTYADTSVPAFAKQQQQQGP